MKVILDHSHQLKIVLMHALKKLPKKLITNVICLFLALGTTLENVTGNMVPAQITTRTCLTIYIKQILGCLSLVYLILDKFRQNAFQMVRTMKVTLDHSHQLKNVIIVASKHRILKTLYVLASYSSLVTKMGREIVGGSTEIVTLMNKI